jgi:moderate conductance mechanosensitive channel
MVKEGSAHLPLAWPAMKASAAFIAGILSGAIVPLGPVPLAGLLAAAILLLVLFRNRDIPGDVLALAVMLLAGMFVLAEDQYGVGDQVDLGHAAGTVEKITLRSVRVRDGLGGVWFVPHGGVARVANMSKESLAVLEVEVARSTSLDALDAEAAALCATLAADADAGPMLAGTPEVVGVVKVTDDRLVCRISVATLPGQQDAVRRRWRLLALRAFEAGTLVAPSIAAPVVNLNTLVAPPDE